MKRPHSAFLLALVLANSEPAAASPPEKIDAMVNRITWGSTSTSTRAAEAQGIDKWLNNQLRPPASADLPESVQAQIDTLRISKTGAVDLAREIDAKLKSINKIEDKFQKLEARRAFDLEKSKLKQDIDERIILRGIYSKNQLQEHMTWFWMNHFSIFANKRDIIALASDYEDQAIRPHALGKFRDILLAAELHPAMLRYLDNDLNTKSRRNENFAREILELHTLGVGSGYSQKDVEEMARTLTGIGLSLSSPSPASPSDQALYVRRGLMEFSPDRHDFGEKVILGKKIEESGISETEEILDFLAHQPQTGRNISRKIAQYFMENPPPQLVDNMSDTFFKSDGDISEVLRTLFNSPMFKASLGKKIKDPIHYVISAARTACEGQTPITNVTPLRSWLDQLGQPIFGRLTPDGYPLDAGAWSGPGQLTMRFEVARQIGQSINTMCGRPTGRADVTSPGPGAPVGNITADTLSAQTKSVLQSARSPLERNILYFSSPEFLHR